MSAVNRVQNFESLRMSLKNFFLGVQQSIQFSSPTEHICTSLSLHSRYMTASTAPLASKLYKFSISTYTVLPPPPPRLLQAKTGKTAVREPREMGMT